jgi:hypothetical protein
MGMVRSRSRPNADNGPAGKLWFLPLPNPRPRGTRLGEGVEPGCPLGVSQRGQKQTESPSPRPQASTRLPHQMQRHFRHPLCIVGATESAGPYLYVPPAEKRPAPSMNRLPSFTGRRILACSQARSQVPPLRHRPHHSPHCPPVTAVGMTMKEAALYFSSSVHHACRGGENLWSAVEHGRPDLRFAWVDQPAERINLRREGGRLREVRVWPSRVRSSARR